MKALAGRLHVFVSFCLSVCQSQNVSHKMLVMRCQSHSNSNGQSQNIVTLLIHHQVSHTPPFSLLVTQLHVSQTPLSYSHSSIVYVSHTTSFSHTPLSYSHSSIFYVCHTTSCQSHTSMLFTLLDCLCQSHNLMLVTLLNVSHISQCQSHFSMLVTGLNVSHTS